MQIIGIFTEWFSFYHFLQHYLSSFYVKFFLTKNYNPKL